MGNVDVAVNDVPWIRWPGPSRVPAVPIVLTMPSHSISNGKAAEADGVVITDDSAMSPVIASARVPNQSPHVSVGVPVVEYSPLARIMIFDPSRSLPAGITGIG